MCVPFFTFFYLFFYFFTHEHTCIAHKHQLFLSLFPKGPSSVSLCLHPPLTPLFISFWFCLIEPFLLWFPLSLFSLVIFMVFQLCLTLDSREWKTGELAGGLKGEFCMNSMSWTGTYSETSLCHLLTVFFFLLRDLNLQCISILRNGNHKTIFLFCVKWCLMQQLVI